LRLEQRFAFPLGEVSVSPLDQDSLLLPPYVIGIRNPFSQDNASPVVPPSHRARVRHPFFVDPSSSHADMKILPSKMSSKNMSPFSKIVGVPLFPLLVIPPSFGVAE